MRRQWIPSLVAVALVLVLAMTFAAWNSADDALTVAVYLGVPLLLAVITVRVLVRRAH